MAFKARVVILCVKIFKLRYLNYFFFTLCANIELLKIHVCLVNILFKRILSQNSQKDS